MGSASSADNAAATAIGQHDFGSLRRQVDFRRQHAGHLFQGFFDPSHAGCAGHVANFQAYRRLAQRGTRCVAHGITGFFYRRLEHVEGDFAARLDAGVFGGEIDAGFLNARRSRQGFFNPRHARAAGHAFDGKAPFLQGDGRGQWYWQGGAGAHACLLKMRRCGESEPSYDGRVKRWLTVTLTGFRIFTSRH